MKKRILAMAFAVMMAFGAAGCGGNAEGGTENTQAVEMQAQLQTYEKMLTPDAAAAEGMFTIAGGETRGKDKWDAFIAGEADSVMLCQFTAKGGAMLDYVAKQEDGSYLVVSDLTRDGYEYEGKEDYQTQVFTQIKVFENFTVQEGGTPHTVCVMTDDAELDAETFLQYWNDLSYEENGAFMLFVI